MLHIKNLTMSEDGVRVKRENIQEYTNILKLFTILQTALDTKIASITKDNYKSRYQIHKAMLSKSLTFVQVCHNKGVLPKIVSKHFYDIYVRYGDFWNTICNDNVHCVLQKDNPNDYDLLSDTQFFLSLDTEKNSYRIPIYNVYTAAVEISKMCYIKYKSDKKIDVNLQPDYLLPWEIKYYLMEVICDSIMLCDPHDKYIDEMKNHRDKLKHNANLTEEQRKVSTKKTANNIVKLLAGAAGGMGFKDKDGNEFDPASMDMAGASEVVTNLLCGGIGESITEAMNDPTGNVVDKCFDSIVPKVRSLLAPIIRPPGVSNEDGTTDEDGLDAMFSDESSAKLKTGFSSMMNIMTDMTSVGK